MCWGGCNEAEEVIFLKEIFQGLFFERKLFVSDHEISFFEI